MRFEPLTLNEQVALTRNLLTDFGYAQEIVQSSTSHDGKRTERKQWHIHDKRNADRSMKIAEAFIDLVNDESMQPATLNDAIEGVRYKLGYGWLAWLFFKTFAVPVIKWLWNRYRSSTSEKSPADPTDFGAYLDRRIAADPELAKLVLEAEQELRKEQHAD